MNQRTLPAGRFSTWLRSMRKALREGRGMDVPCGECNACCRSSYFVPVRADETETIRCIPKRLLFPAPLHPKGDMVIACDDRGRCPMLSADGCSIYRDRPAACRIFDCRVLAASGLAAGVGVDNDIFKQARRWRFSCPTKRDEKQLAAVCAAANFLQEYPRCMPGGVGATGPIELSVSAIKVFEAFVGE